MIFITLLFNVILNFQSTKMIWIFNVLGIFILFILIYAKFYTNFSSNLTYYISQHKCILLWFFNCSYFCQFFKIDWLINQTDSTFTLKFLVLIVLFCIWIKCLQSSGLKAKCYWYFISLEFCELIREKCDEFLSFILHALLYFVILIYFSLHVVFSLNSKILLSYFQLYICLL